MNYLPSSTAKIILFVSEALALFIAIAGVASGGNSNMNQGANFLFLFISWSLILNIGIYLVCFIIQFIRNGVQRDMMSTQIMKDEYYRMEARKRIDKES